MELERPTFKPATVQRILALSMDAKTKVNQDALKLTAEYMRMFVHEAVFRASVLAAADDEFELTPEHLEKVLPQLLLDF